MKNLSIYCADVGSIKAKNFGWACSRPTGELESGTDIAEFAEKISSNILLNGSKVAVGFECPLFVPMRDDELRVNSSRAGEGNRSWSAGAGTGALATGLVEVLWVMRRVNSLIGSTPRAELGWDAFSKSNSVFLWEAFVSSSSKGSSHEEDAEIAVREFRDGLPNPMTLNAIHEESVLSLVGAAALRARWASDIEILSQACLVVKA